MARVAFWMATGADADIAGVVGGGRKDPVPAAACPSQRASKATPAVYLVGMSGAIASVDMVCSAGAACGTVEGARLSSFLLQQELYKNSAKESGRT